MQNDTIALFIDEAELADIPRAGGLGLAALPPLTGNGKEAAVVDSNVVTYADSVPGGMRDDVANWLLLAQRVATKKVADPNDTEAWTKVYYDTLEGTGWSKREEFGSWHKESAFNSTVHENILRVATVLLGPVAPVALAIITAAVTALGDMDKNSPWITLFDRRGESATAVGFQVADCATDDGVAVLRGLDFRFYAETTFTQVLLFRFVSERSELHRRLGTLYLSPETRAKYGPAVRAKVEAIISDNLAALEI